jgi:hypothetical protein
MTDSNKSLSDEFLAGVRLENGYLKTAPSMVVVERWDVIHAASSRVIIPNLLRDHAKRIADGMGSSYSIVENPDGIMPKGWKV